jgi:hypothetical protein
MRGEVQIWQQYTVSRQGEPPLVFTAKLVLHHIVPASRSNPNCHYLVRVWKMRCGFRAAISRFLLWRPDDTAHEVFDGDALDEVVRTVAKHVPRHVSIAIEGELRGARERE